MMEFLFCRNKPPLKYYKITNSKIDIIILLKQLFYNHLDIFHKISISRAKCLNHHFQSIEYLLIIKFSYKFYIKFYFVKVTPPSDIFCKKILSGGSYLDVYGNTIYFFII